jgi:hypothetical protein
LQGAISMPGGSSFVWMPGSSMIVVLAFAMTRAGFVPRNALLGNWLFPRCRLSQTRQDAQTTAPEKGFNLIGTSSIVMRREGCSALPGQSSLPPALDIPEKGGCKYSERYRTFLNFSGNSTRDASRSVDLCSAKIHSPYYHSYYQR